jgi:hypothetical protein
MTANKVFLSCFLCGLLCPPLLTVGAPEKDLDVIMQTVGGKISEDRVRNYTKRLWQHHKWNTLPACSIIVFLDLANRR